MGIFSKVSTYNDKLEKILENKNYKSETKNLLLNMLYKIESSFADYEKVKAKSCSKEEFIEKILEIIESKCDEITTVTPKTEESRELELKEVNCVVDEQMGTILVYANEKDLLYSICQMDIKYNIYKNKDMYFINKDEEESEYIYKAIKKFLITGAAMDISEIIRDFNGWSWNTEIKDVENISYNLLYQNISILLDDRTVKNTLIPEYKREERNIFNVSTNKENLSRLNETQFTTINIEEESEKINYNEIIEKALKKNYTEENLSDKIRNMCLTILAIHDENTKKAIMSIADQQKKQLELMEDNKKFLNEVTRIKKAANIKIKSIDEMLNNKDDLQKEYERRNSKLANVDKIFSISHLANMLEDERNQYLLQIQKYNKMMEPMQYVQEKERLKEKYIKINNIILAMDKNIFENNIINIQKEFLKCFFMLIEKANTKQELVDLIYKLRYYCMLPVNEIQKIKDIPELKPNIEEVINALIDKSIDKKVIENVSNSISLCYNTLKYIFECKIIDLEKLNIKITKNKEEIINNKKEKIYYISIILYDSKDEEEVHNEKVNNLKQLNIKLNKKVAIILK